MPEYDNTNRGALFKNDRKERESQPDYTGNLDVGGVDHWLSAWIKKDRNGKTYMSLSVKPKDEQIGSDGIRRGGDNNEDIPF